MNEPISMAERADTYARHLQEAGYHTAYIGKHHYIDTFNVGMDMTDIDEDLKGYGYDHFWQVGDVAECGSKKNKTNEDRYTKWLASRGKLEEYRENFGQEYYEQMEPSETVDGYVCETALAYLKEYDQDKPLMLTVGIVGPHGPYWAPGNYRDMFSPEKMPDPVDPISAESIERSKVTLARELGMIALIDDYVGKLLDVLKKKGMTENTLVAFTSDHGELVGDHGRYDKRHYYEQSVKVPLILAGAGVTVDARAPYNRNKALISGIDLYPTFLDAAGCENILGNSRRQGLSILRIVDETQAKRKEIFSELGTTMMVADGNWKLVYDPEQNGVQYLFNMRRDPNEMDNLAGVPEYRGVEADLQEKLLEQMIRLTRHTHMKEQIAVQRVRV